MSAKIISIDVTIPIGDITRNGRLKKHNHLFTTPPLKPKRTCILKRKQSFYLERSEFRGYSFKLAS